MSFKGRFSNKEIHVILRKSKETVALTNRAFIDECSEGRHKYYKKKRERNFYSGIS